MRGPRNGVLRTWSGAKVSSHTQSAPGAVGLSSAADCLHVRVLRTLLKRSRGRPRARRGLTWSWPGAIARRRSTNCSARSTSPRRCPTPSPAQRVGHAYLFTGARGVGKTSAARILAKALNCEHGPAAVALQPVRHLPQHQLAATTSTCWRSTAPAIAASTRSASCGRTSTCGPAGRDSRFTSSTKSTCSPARPSTPC